MGRKEDDRRRNRDEGQERRSEESADRSRRSEELTEGAGLDESGDYGETFMTSGIGTDWSENDEVAYRTKNMSEEARASNIEAEEDALQTRDAARQNPYNIEQVTGPYGLFQGPRGLSSTSPLSEYPSYAAQGYYDTEFGDLERTGEPGSGARKHGPTNPPAQGREPGRPAVSRRASGGGYAEGEIVSQSTGTGDPRQAGRDPEKRSDAQRYAERATEAISDIHYGGARPNYERPGPEQREATHATHREYATGQRPDPNINASTQPSEWRRDVDRAPGVPGVGPWGSPQQQNWGRQDWQGQNYGGQNYGGQSWGSTPQARGYGGSLTQRPDYVQHVATPTPPATPVHARPGAVPGETTSHEETIRDLNAAVAAQAMAAYRYLYLSKWVGGISHGPIAETFAETAHGEWKHVEKFMERVIELGGMPVPSPEHWSRFSYGRYAEPPRDPRDIRRALQDSINDEETAIHFYEQLANKTAGRDHVTYMLAVEALKDEVKDREKFRAYME